MPADVKERLTREVRKAVDTPEVAAYLEKSGYVKMNTSAADAKAWLAREKQRWTDLIVSKNILKD